MTILVDSKSLIFSLMENHFDKKLNKDFFQLSDPIYIQGEYNTELNITPYKNTGFYGVSNFKYNRISTNDIERLNITKGSAILYSELIEQIANIAGLSIIIPNDNGEAFENKISATDIIDSIIPEITGEYLDVTIQTSHLSLIFYGEIKLRIRP